MNLQQINIKVYVTDDSQIDYSNFIKVFNRWMAEAEQDDYLNYADYSHTEAGPGVLLISKRANYSIDNAHYRNGFLYNRKHDVDGENVDKIRQALVETLEKCRRIEAAEELENAVRFNGDDILFMVNNRQVVPNSAETFEGVKPDLVSVLQGMYGDDDFTLERASADQRERFAVRIAGNSGKGVAELLANLESTLD